MTNHAHGSSLVQAREATSHQRRHNHNLNHYQHLHQHRLHIQQHNQHVRSHADSPITPPPSLPQERRQISDAVESIITEVIQTVSVIQYVDGAGLPVAISTVFSSPLTQIVDPVTEITLDSSLVNPPLPTLPSSLLLNPGSSAGGNAGGGGSPSYSQTSISPSTSASAPIVTPQPPLTVTSSPSGALPLPTTGTFNSTSSTGLFNSTSIRSPFSNSSSILTTSLSSSLSETTLSTSTSSSSSSLAATLETTAVAGGLTGDAGIPAPTSTAADSGATSPLSRPATGTLVGGVVGGICGTALLLFVVVFILRWRRRRDNSHHRMLTDGAGDAGGASRGFSSNMSERGIPFSVPAALAALSGKKSIAAPAAGEERGFVRVSGRKLPSVLHHGGDGYTNPFADPRDSVVSGDDQSVMYRDSNMFFSAPPGSGGGGVSPGGSRLKLGSPMRPESGIPVIQPGPARTPVQEVVAAFPLPPSGTTALRPPPSPLSRPQDPIGRSRPSLDGSRTSRLSQSRFTENIR